MERWHRKTGTVFSQFWSISAAVLEQHCINTGAVLDHCCSGAVLGWFGAVLEQYCGCIEEILEQCWSSAAAALQQDWSSTGVVLQKCLSSIGLALPKYRSDAGARLQQYWSSAGAKKSISLRFERLFQNLMVRQAWFRSGSRPTVAVSAQY